MITGTQMATRRDKFQFSNAQAQSAEARLNAQEARKLVERWVPKHLQEPAAEEPTTAAGACFRKVTAHLKGRGK